MTQEEPELDRKETDVMRSQGRLYLEVVEESRLSSYRQEEGAKEKKLLKQKKKD